MTSRGRSHDTRADGGRPEFRVAKAVPDRVRRLNVCLKSKYFACFSKPLQNSDRRTSSTVAAAARPEAAAHDKLPAALIRNIRVAFVQDVPTPGAGGDHIDGLGHGLRFAHGAPPHLAPMK